MIGTITAVLCGFLAIFCIILFILSVKFHQKAEEIRKKGKKYYDFTRTSLPDVKIELGDDSIVQEMEQDIFNDNSIFGDKSERN